MVVAGDDVMIDRNIVEKLSAPLVHMVRNSIDHGIESTEERRRAGKPLLGTVRLCAYEEAPWCVIELSDDGKGLNRDVLLQKSRLNGLVKPDETPSDEQIYDLIFNPGFSTAETITALSGRGVWHGCGQAKHRGTRGTNRNLNRSRQWDHL